jgi:glycosyltransferase involved in cell wall biosynthesis
MIEIVAATRSSQEQFWDKSALGISLRRLEHDRRLVPRLAFENRQALPDVYNPWISAGDGNDMIAFMHDDLWIDDFFLADHVIEGLRVYDVIGVAGNRNRVDNQPAWAFSDLSLDWNNKIGLSGSIGHGDYPFGAIECFGKVPADCEFLDGVFLAAKKAVLRANNLFFDPRFDFHFYDMDFCRSARQCRLKLGTWPICLTHQSGGTFGTEPWMAMYRTYLKKWGN